MIAGLFAYGAAFELSKIFLSFSSCWVGLLSRCFSSELRRSMGEIGVSSIPRSGVFSSVIADVML